MKTWNREELYAEIWEQPASKVAAKYGISDVMLRKVCRKLSIPVPGGGPQRREVYAGSFHVATYDNGTTFFDHTDWQATERVRSNVSGVSALTCTNLPYGDNQSCVGPLDPSPQHFTGKMRDPETGLDYFGARYYSSGTARWMLPDWSAVPEAVPYADMSNPQSLNLYTYVGNNPINGVDADGHDPQSQNGGAQCGSSVGEQGLAAGNAPGQVACSSPAPAPAQQQSTPAATVPLTLPPLVFPSWEGAAGNLLDGFLDLLGDVAVPLAILANPASTASESQDTIQQPAPAQPRRPTADVRGQADQAATDANGNLRCAYCGQVLTPEAGEPNSREYDHVTPHSQGGGRTADNIKDACRSCNRQKGPRTPEQWGGPQP